MDVSDICIYVSFNMAVIMLVFDVENGTLQQGALRYNVSIFDSMKVVTVCNPMLSS